MFQRNILCLGYLFFFPPHFPCTRPRFTFIIFALSSRDGLKGVAIPFDILSSRNADRTLPERGIQMRFRNARRPTLLFFFSFFFFFHRIIITLITTLRMNILRQPGVIIFLPPPPPPVDVIYFYRLFCVFYFAPLP